MSRLNLIGQKFGRLYVNGFAYVKDGRTFWNCICDCGTPCVIKGKYLTNGDTKSCGCLSIERTTQMGQNNKRPNQYKVIDDTTTKVFFNNTNNYFICDTEDWNRLSKYTWFETEHGYARTLYDDGKFVFFHNAVMKFIPTIDVVCDHYDRNRLNNKKSNLRIVNRKCNATNRNIGKNNTSGHVGVSYHKQSQKWQASIGVNNKQLYLGCFDTYEEAVSVREKAEQKYFKGMKSNVS